jgi:dolichol-phosphate mannosyltransferase
MDQETICLNWQFSILVVDDYSPDGTADRVRQLQKEYQQLFLLEGKKEGLGKAYIRGFQWVLQHRPDTDYIFEMDSDLSHHPAYIKDFLHAADTEYNFIIGSRYIKGGNCPDWKWYRKMLSYWGNQYIRFIGGMTQVHDCTSGYRCIGVQLLAEIDFSKLLTKGYAFQMSLLHQAIQKGAIVKEIPIVFTDRKEGKSKLGKNDIRECLLTATKLRWRKY